MVEEADRRGGVRERVDQEIGGGERGIEFGGSGECAGAAGAGEKLHLGVKGCEHACEAAGDPTGAQKEHALASERADRGFDLRFDPAGRGLRDEQPWQLAVKRENAGEGRFGDGAIVEAGQVGEDHGRGTRRGVEPEVGVDASGLELHPAQACRSAEPRSGDVAENHVRGSDRSAFFELGEFGAKREGVGREGSLQPGALCGSETGDGDAEVHRARSNRRITHGSRPDVPVKPETTQLNHGWTPINTNAESRPQTLSSSAWSERFASADWSAPAARTPGPFQTPLKQSATCNV